jgi:hypothetical protein
MRSARRRGGVSFRTAAAMGSQVLGLHLPWASPPPRWRRSLVQSKTGSGGAGRRLPDVSQNLGERRGEVGNAGECGRGLNPWWPRANRQKGVDCRSVRFHAQTGFKSLFPLHLPRQVLDLPGFLFADSEGQYPFSRSINRPAFQDNFLACRLVPSWRHLRRGPARASPHDLDAPTSGQPPSWRHFWNGAAEAES